MAFTFEDIDGVANFDVAAVRMTARRLDGTKYIIWDGEELINPGGVTWTDITGKPVVIAEGATWGDARASIRAAASGANGDITELTGLTTPLSIPQGGTGATTIEGARSALGIGVGHDSAATVTPTADSIPIAKPNGKLDSDWLDPIGVVTPVADGIPKAGATGKLHSDWLVSNESTSPVANGVPKADATGKIDIGWIDTSTLSTPSSTPHGVPQAGATGKLDNGWINLLDIGLTPATARAALELLAIGTTAESARAALSVEQTKLNNHQSLKTLNVTASVPTLVLTDSDAVSQHINVQQDLLVNIESVAALGARSGDVVIYLTLKNASAFTVTWSPSIDWSDGEQPEFIFGKLTKVMIYGDTINQKWVGSTIQNY